MGGHGGLNILPQKRCNVYNYENREKVRRDQESAAKEKQLKREQSRKRDAEFRLERLRQAHGLAPLVQSDSSQAASVANSPETVPETETEPESKSKLNHINLFEGIRIFDPDRGGSEGKGEDERGVFKKMKMMDKEAAPRTVAPEDEKYRLGYGIAGKGVKLPWYMSKPSDDANGDGKGSRDDDLHDRSRIGNEKAKSSGKKTSEELREERLRREKLEKERERALMLENDNRRGEASLKNKGFSIW